MHHLRVYELGVACNNFSSSEIMIRSPSLVTMKDERIMKERKKNRIRFAYRQLEENRERGWKIFEQFRGHFVVKWLA